MLCKAQEEDMTVIAFDTLDFAKKLRDAGLNPKVAEVQAEETAKIFSDFATNQLASKQDISDVKENIDFVKHDLKDVEIRLEKQIHEFRQDLLKEIHANTWKIIGLLAGLQAIFHFIK